MSLKNVSRNDLEKIKELQPDGWSDISKEFEFYIKSDFCIPVKTEMDGKIVGIGAAIAFKKSAWLAHIIVDKDYRNRGIGNDIVKELISRLKEKKSIETYMLIATEIGRPVYLKSDFRDLDNYLFMKRGQLWKGKPVSDKIFDYKKEYRSAIYDLDFDVSGEKREKLLEPYLDAAGKIKLSEKYQWNCKEYGKGESTMIEL